MVKIVFTPDWFLGKDILVEFFSFIVLAIFSVLAIKGYKLKGNKGLLHLGFGFGFIAVARLVSVFTKLILYYDAEPVQAFGKAIMTSQVVSSIDIFYYAGFFSYYFLTLVGLFIIYKIPQKRLLFSGDYVLVLYFIALVSLFSKEFFYLFHVTAFLMLILIIINYLMVYRENKFMNTRILIISFSILALSQLVYILSKIGVFFALSNIMELISYTILLFLIIRIIKHG